MKNICIIHQTNWQERVFFYRYGYRTEAHPMLSVNIHNHVKITEFPYKAFCVTSQNAIKWLITQEQELLQGKTVYCISKKQANTLKLNGFKPVISPSPNADSLVQYIEKHCKNEHLLFLGGNRSLFPVHHKNISNLTVYSSRLCPHKVEDNAIDALVFFSPSGVDAYYSKNTNSKGCPVFAIGKTTAQKIHAHDKSDLYISEKQDSQSYYTFVCKTLKHIHYGISV